MQCRLNGASLPGIGQLPGAKQKINSQQLLSMSYDLATLDLTLEDSLVSRWNEVFVQKSDDVIGPTTDWNW